MPCAQCNGLKAQNMTAQGNALGTNPPHFPSPEGAAQRPYTESAASQIATPR
jgi:hypothetical protein